MKTPVTHLTRQARHEFEMDAIAACFIGGTAVTGGIGTIPGAMVGGLVLGLCESFATGYISSAYEDALAFALLVLILIFRPAGILGKPKVQKV